MECGNRFCIYQKGKECILETIEIDISGCCLSCIYPDIPSQILETEKEMTRKRFEEEYVE